MVQNIKKVVALIPARSGSKRIKDKNIRELGCHPLIGWSITAAQQSGYIFKHNIFVSSDSERYLNIAMQQYGTFSIKRPPEICRDDSTDSDVIKHFLSVVRCDLIVYLRPTTPFRSVHLIDEAIHLMAVPGYDSLRSVEEMPESAFKMFKIKFQILQPLTGGVDLTDKPNQLLPRTYRPNGYIDILRSEIVQQGSLWGAGRYAFVTPRTIEIDTPEDFEYAEWWAIHRAQRWGFGKEEI